MACQSAWSRELQYSAQIRRTSFGIPHVVAQDEAGIGYGIGYAYAQDNACMFAEALVTVNGERSRYFGPQQIGGPDVETGSFKVPNLQSDFFFKRLNAPQHIARAWAHQSAEAKDLLRGYTAGFNRYLAEAGPGGLPGPCRGAPWVRRITEQDLMRFARRIASEGTSIPLMQALGTAQPPAQMTVSTVAVPDGLESMREEGLGSNAVALGRQATENGRGLLFGNPHYPWYGTLRYYQLHLTIPGKLDAMGVTFGGLPLVRTGFNRHVAWTHTVNTSGHVAFYALALDPKDPTQYLLDGRVKAMTKDTVTVEVREPDGRLVRQSHDFWGSEFGPIVVVAGKLDWTRRTAYALFDPSFENHRIIEQWYAMDLARSVEDLRLAITSLVGLPWTNTIATDAAGNTLFTAVSLVPRVTQAKQNQCVAEPYRKWLEENMWVLTASASCVLETGPGAPQSGVFSGIEFPTLRRSDFVQNSNGSAWLANPAEPLTGFAPIITRENAAQNGRTRLGITQILAHLAGEHRSEGGRIGMHELQRMVLDNQSYFGTLLREDLRAVCADTRPVTVEDNAVEVAEACAALARWDGHANQDSIGYFVAMKWIRGLAREKDIWAVPFSARDPVNTPRDLQLNDATAVGKVRLALARAVLEAQRAGIDVGKPWGELQFVDLGGGRRLPMHGGDGGDSYNLIRGEAREGAVRVRYGSSYVLTVQFEDDGPRAEAFLTYSQSTDPASPHFADQAPRFAERRWIAQPFTEAQIKADPNYRTQRIAEKAGRLPVTAP